MPQYTILCTSRDRRVVDAPSSVDSGDFGFNRNHKPGDSMKISQDRMKVNFLASSMQGKNFPEEESSSMAWFFRDSLDRESIRDPFLLQVYSVVNENNKYPGVYNTGLPVRTLLVSCCFTCRSVATAFYLLSGEEWRTEKAYEYSSRCFSVYSRSQLIA